MTGTWRDDFTVEEAQGMLPSNLRDWTITVTTTRAIELRPPNGICSMVQLDTLLGLFGARGARIDAVYAFKGPGLVVTLEFRKREVWERLPCPGCDRSVPECTCLPF